MRDCFLMILFCALMWSAPAAEESAGVPYAGLAVADAADGGVLVSAVAHYGPADRGGVNAGDVVLRVDDRSLATAAELAAVLRAARPGQQVKLLVQWRHRQLTRVITLTNRLEPQAVFHASDQHLTAEQWESLEHQQRIIAAQLATPAPDTAAIAAAFAEIRRLRGDDRSGEGCHLFFWGRKSVLHIRGNEDSLVATEVFFAEGKPDELYRLSGPGAVPCLPERLRLRIRAQLELLPDFPSLFSLNRLESR